MSSTTSLKAARARGGSFLIEDLSHRDVFTPEDFTTEQRQIAKTAHDFAVKEVLPAADEIEAKNFEVTVRLLRMAGELGLLAVDIPESYGGLEMDKVTSALVTENISALGSFSVAFNAHGGIGTLPIVWYGTEEQKRKYLPKLATAEWVAAYALSESTSGSDAMHIRTRATLDPTGKYYILNGEKMWISNSGFADLFTVFAKIDGEQFSAFLIERNTPGLSIGAEEHKLGIRGSSTCPLVLADCKVPVENLLGEPGKGHHIAFNVLNIGRFKLGAATLGAAQHSLVSGISYAKERKAFGKPIAEFGLIQEKLAECGAAIYACEALTYRTAGMIDAALADVDQRAPGASLEIQRRIEDYALECSIMKVWGSEMLDMVVDHVLQIHGGYGYVEEYPAERPYRDSRINRIFEGTNEINRLIITGWLMKRALSGQLPLMTAIKNVMEELLSPGSVPETDDHPLGAERQILANAKKLALFAAGAASQRHPRDLPDQQEIMGALADCIIEIYALESCLLRAEKLLAREGEKTAANAIHLTSYYTAKAIQTIESSVRKVIASVAEGDLLRTQMSIVRRLAKYEPINTIELGRRIAQHLLIAGRYTL